MITPGVAGALVLVISNTAFTQFGIPAKWSSLILSFLLGTLVFAGTVAAQWQKGLLYLLNSAIIFSVAVGTNQVGTGLSGQSGTGLSGQSKDRNIEALIEANARLSRDLKEAKGLSTPTITPVAIPEATQAHQPPFIRKKPTPPTIQFPRGQGFPQKPAGRPQKTERSWFHNWFDQSG